MENEGEPIHGANISSHPSPECDEALGRSPCRCQGSCDRHSGSDKSKLWSGPKETPPTPKREIVGCVSKCSAGQGETGLCLCFTTSARAGRGGAAPSDTTCARGFSQTAREAKYEGLAHASGA